VILRCLLGMLAVVLTALSTRLAAEPIPAYPNAIALPSPDQRAQLYPEIATDGAGTFLVVWQQGRLYFEAETASVYVLRLDAAGRPLDRQPIALSATGGSQERPRVVFSAGVFFVVWHDLRNGRDWDVYAARVKPDGTVLDRSGTLVAGGVANQASPAVAPAPTGALIVWQHYGGRFYQVNAAVLSARGEVGPVQTLGYEGRVLHGGDISVARMGERWLLAWKDETQWTAGGDRIIRFFATVRLDGQRLEVTDVERAPGVLLGRGAGRLASDGAEAALFAAWGAVGRGREIPVGAVFEAGSAAARPNPEPVQAPGISEWDGSRMLMLFAMDAQVTGPVTIAFGGEAFLLAGRMAASGKGPPSFRIVTSRFARDGRRLGTVKPLPVVHESRQALGNPALAFGGEAFLLVFGQDDGDGRQRLFAKLVSPE